MKTLLKNHFHPKEKDRTFYVLYERGAQVIACG